MRCIDKAGGFDAYIYHTREKKLQSKLGMTLKGRMIDVVEKFDLTPPTRVVRLPRPPRSLENVTNSTVSSDGSVEGSVVRRNIDA